MKSLVVKILLTFSIIFLIGIAILSVIFIQSCQKSTDIDNVIKDKPEYTIGTIDSIGVIHNEFLQYFFDEMKDQKVCPEMKYIFKYNNHQYIRKTYYTDMCEILKEAAIQRGWSDVDVDNAIDSIDTFFTSISMFDVVNGTEVVKRIQDKVDNILEGALLQNHINSDIYNFLKPIVAAYDSSDFNQIDNLVKAINPLQYSGDTQTYLYEFLSVYNHSHDFWKNFVLTEGSQLKKSSKILRSTALENGEKNITDDSDGSFLIQTIDAIGGILASRLSAKIGYAIASGLATMMPSRSYTPIANNPWAPAWCYCGCFKLEDFCTCGENN